MALTNLTTYNMKIKLLKKIRRDWEYAWDGRGICLRNKKTGDVRIHLDITTFMIDMISDYVGIISALNWHSRSMNRERNRRFIKATKTN